MAGEGLAHAHPVGDTTDQGSVVFFLAFATNHIYYEWVRYIHAAGR
jgi:hypothetical protein